MKRRKNEQPVLITTEQANMLRSLVANLMGVAVPCSQCKQPDAARIHCHRNRERAPRDGPSRNEYPVWPAAPCVLMSAGRQNHGA